MSDYKEIIDSMVWSYSRLSAYAQCKYSFYLGYIIDDDEEYLSEGNYWADVGIFMHEILEMIFKHELNPDDAVVYFIDHYDDRVLYQASPGIMQKNYDACIEYLSNEDFWWCKECDILGVEKQFNVEISGYRFTGYIDLLLRNKHTGDIILMDHKSASYPLSTKGDRVLKNHERSFESYKKQMYLYCNAVKQIYGEFPRHIVWNHFKDSRMVKIEFDINEYDEAMRWFIDTIDSIKNEQNYPESTDYFYCNNLCNFRNCCEYCKEEWGR